MSQYLPTIILRHRRENLKKCSLTGLESRPDMEFYTYPKSHLPEKQNYIILSMDGPELSMADKDYGIYLIDGTWKLAEKMTSTLTFSPIERSLPKHFRTAYPRRQTGCADPEVGLASAEALFIVYHILGRPTSGLLDNYHFKDEFFHLNPELCSDSKKLDPETPKGSALDPLKDEVL
jgi:pre-rRNA-processing protein TSR3